MRRHPPFGAGERTRGVSTLRAQSRCAFRGFAETRLDSRGAGAAVARIQRARARRACCTTLCKNHMARELAGLEALAARARPISQPTARWTSARLRALAKALRERAIPGGAGGGASANALPRLLHQWLELESDCATVRRSSAWRKAAQCAARGP